MATITMTKEDLEVVPFIDISPYLKDPTSRAAKGVIEAVGKASRNSGFFSLTGHGIPRELGERVLKAGRDMFALPYEEKMTAEIGRIDGLKNRGYEAMRTQALQEGALPDLKEGFYVGQHISKSDPRVKAHPNMVGENIFPTSLADADLKEPTEAYQAALVKLSITMMEILAKTLPYGDNVFDDYNSGTLIGTMAILHYPPQTSTDERQFGISEHTDFGAISFLLQDECSGLEVEDPSTGRWIKVAPDPDALVFNIGDMLDMWTRGALKSSKHRVRNWNKTDRYSVPFFYYGNPGTKLLPLDGGKPKDGVVHTSEGYLFYKLETIVNQATESKKKEGEI